MTGSNAHYAATLYGLVPGEAAGIIRAASALLAQKPLWGALTSSTVSLQEKEDLIRSAPPLEGQETLRGFLSLLLKEKQLSAFPAILEEFQRLDMVAPASRPYWADRPDWFAEALCHPK